MTIAQVLQCKKSKSNRIVYVYVQKLEELPRF